ncbi:MAG: hypothetical protein PHG82_04575 [Candidatus Gracilibacteria bacterium]|nr:hypothetical protein [Candidatus Gracilibacteria bacterium]
MDKQKSKLVYGSIIIIVIIGIVIFFLLNKGGKTNNYENKKIIENTNVSNYLDTISINKLAGILYTESGATEINKKIDYLVSKNDLGKASFLSSFLGDYKNSLNYRDSLCKNQNNENKEFCDKLDTKLKLSISDTKGNKITGVKISVDGNINFNQNKDLYNNFVHRLRFSKKGYLDSYEKVVLGNGSDSIIETNPKLLKTNYIINTDSNKEISYKTKKFDYKIDANSFVNLDGSPVSGNIDIYFFDIGASDGDLSVLNLDVFDENGTLLGSSMSTLGMPLIKAYSGENELKLAKEITGTGIIQNLERAPGIDLVNVPKNTWLTKVDLDKYNIPPFWNLDQTNGVWKTSSMKILDEKGNYEFKLY